MTPVASKSHFPADVKRAYSRFDESKYKAPMSDMPAKAQAALRQYAGGNLDVAEFVTKSVDRRGTYAIFLPSVDSGDIHIVDASGRTVADGTVQYGNTNFDWFKAK